MACWFEWNTKEIYLIGRCQCIDISRVSCPLYRYVEPLCTDFNSIGFNLNFFVSIIWRHFVEIRWKLNLKKIKLILIWLFFFCRSFDWLVDGSRGPQIGRDGKQRNFVVGLFRLKLNFISREMSSSWNSMFSVWLGAWIDFVPITKVTQRTVYFSMNFLKMNYFWINFE